ncbi:MAG: hypothetical protein HC830_02165, partial [Bacteroidetes bacterium]|nr:hypothetical protein [Bacteroidota bacterium]
MKFNNLKIRTKLLLGFLAVIIVMVIVGIIGFIGLQTLGGQLQEVTDNRLPSINALQNIREGQTSIKASERTLLMDLLTNKEIRATQFSNINLNWKKIDEAMNIYSPLEQTVEEKKKWDEFLPGWNEWRSLSAKFHVLLKTQDSLKNQLTLKGNNKKALAEMKTINTQILQAGVKIAPLITKCETELNSLININVSTANELKQKADQSISFSNFLLLAVAGVGL